MLKAEIKKIILTRLDEVLKPLGYIRRVTDGIRYLKATDQYIDSFCLIPLSDAIEGTGFYREHIEVANILFEVARNIQKPYIYIDEFRKKNLYLPFVIIQFLQIGDTMEKILLI